MDEVVDDERVDEVFETELGTRFMVLMAGGTITVSSNEHGDVFLDVVVGQRKVPLQLTQREAMVLIEFLAVAARPGSGARIVMSAADVSAALGSGSGHSGQPRQESVSAIQRAVCAHFNLRVADLCSHARGRMVTGPRMIAMYLCKQRINISYSELGKKFGGRDHSTVMHAVKVVRNKLNRADSVVANNIATIVATLEDLADQTVLR